jgi:hypothetical protein
MAEAGVVGNGRGETAVNRSLMERMARWYAAHGLRTLPLRPFTKLPLLPQWPERATTVAATISEWWSRWPTAGIGIATGAASGVIVVDIDPRHGGDDTFAALERANGEAPPTWRCLTPGGLHLYFRHPGGHVGNRAGLWPGVDLRGDGGYVVAPPTMLADGRGYCWEAGHGPHELAASNAPTWLLERLHQEGATTPRSPGFWRQLVTDGVDEGGRNQAIAQLAGTLLRRRVDPYVTCELILAWNARRCRPPLPEQEVLRVLDSIARKEAMRRGVC